MWECFLVALRLGLISFGGPVAHLGFFREEYVERRRWLKEEEFTGLLAICQLLPGPSSSQLGAAIGHSRAGWKGGIAAWAGFTLPSALFMGCAALFLTQSPGLSECLIVAAVAAVTVALGKMAQSLCRGMIKAGVAFGGLLLMLVVPTAWMQVGVILLGAAVGVAVFEKEEPKAVEGKKSSGYLLPLCLLIVTSVAVWVFRDAIPVYAALYEAGALVFGGGHVVLPLLEEGVVDSGLIDEQSFIEGYGVAQAVPGPLFTFGTYLGALAGGAAGAVLGTVAIFLPGLLMLAAVLPVRQRCLAKPWAAAAVAGASSAVVGLLAYALWGMVSGGEVDSIGKVVACLAAIVCLWRGWLPAWAVVLLLCALGWLGAL